MKTIEHRFGRRLQVGQVVWHEGCWWIVERLNAGSATIYCTGGRPIGTRQVDFADGRSTTFTEYKSRQRPGQRQTVSLRAQFEDGPKEVEHGG